MCGSTPDRAETPHSLYHGTAGIILFLLEQHRATGDQHALRQAVAAGRVVVADLEGRSSLTCAIYSGWPGHIVVLNELGKASGDSSFVDAASMCVDRMMAQSQPLGAGIGWIEPMPFADITGVTGEREILDLSVGSAGAAWPCCTRTERAFTIGR